MAERLNLPFGVRLQGRRLAAWLALVLAVVLMHGGVVDLIAQRAAEFSLAQSMPPRIEVAFVREMALAEPPAASPVVAPAPMRRPAVAPKPAKAASAPDEAWGNAARDAVAAAPAIEQAPPPVPAPIEPAPALPKEPGSDALPDLATPRLAEAPSEAPPPEPVVSAVEPPAPVPLVPRVASAALPFDWPSSTRITYVLTGNYRGEVQGSGQVEWVRAGSRYQVHVDIIVGPSLAPLITRRMSSDGELTSEGLSPRRYDEDTKVVFRDRRRLTMTFEPNEVVLASGERRERWPGVQDSASQFVQLTYLFTTQPELLRVGQQFEVPLALPRKIDRWIYDVVKEEILFTPFGEVPAFHVKPRRAGRTGGDLTAEIWFAPQLRYLPVRIRLQQDAETFLDLMLDRRPQIAAP